MGVILIVLATFVIVGLLLEEGGGWVLHKFMNSPPKEEIDLDELEPVLKPSKKWTQFFRKGSPR